MGSQRPRVRLPWDRPWTDEVEARIPPLPRALNAVLGSAALVMLAAMGDWTATLHLPSIWILGGVFGLSLAISIPAPDGTKIRPSAFLLIVAVVLPTGQASVAILIGSVCATLFLASSWRGALRSGLSRFYEPALAVWCASLIRGVAHGHPHEPLVVLAAGLSNLIASVTIFPALVRLSTARTSFGRLARENLQLALAQHVIELPVVILAAYAWRSSPYTLALLAPLVGAAMLLTRQNARLLVLSQRLSRDELTGVLNRTGWIERAHLTLGQSAAERSEAWVGMLDVDDFKQINDTLGHATGDRLLVLAAAAIEAAVAPMRGAIVGRYGGEEFLVLLPCHRREALPMLETIRRDVSGALAEYGRTISIGAGAIAPGEDLFERLAMADDALYLAKRRGKDRVETTDAVERQSRLALHRDEPECGVAA